MLDTTPSINALGHAQGRYKKKLIEVALPLQAINLASAREKNGISHVHGHPSTIHFWWAPRPLVACRALLFALLVDDPSSDPERYPTQEHQDRERARLFKIIERLVVWENSLNVQLLSEVHSEIVRSIGEPLPTVYDPFCGRGAIPIEAQRLGLPVEASDLNPVAVTVAKALIEIPWTFRGHPPVHPSLRGPLSDRSWERATGLAADVAAYGKWMFDEARSRIGHLFPKVRLSSGRDASAIAWLWARTVRCGNPVCGAEMPLIKSFALSTKLNREWFVEPIVDELNRTVNFEVRRGTTHREGTIGRTGATCIICGGSVPLDYIRAEGKAKRIGERLLAIVAEGDRGRDYISPDPLHERMALEAVPDWSRVPDTDLPKRALGFRVQAYGMTKHHDLFTARQLLTLTTISALVKETHECILTDARAALLEEGEALENNGRGARAYADAVATYLAMAVDRQASYSSNLCTWNSPAETMFQVFTRQIIQIKWDFAEVNPFSDSTGNFGGAITWVEKALAATSAGAPGAVKSRDAADGETLPIGVFSTDPPYYDNVPYADLSDFFYVWLRSSLREVYPDLLSTVLVPKSQELISDPARFNGDGEKAREQFEEGLKRAFAAMRLSVRGDIPAMVIYAFKQSDRATPSDSNGGDRGRISVGWEAMLSALLTAGFQITGTWPLTMERQGRLRSVDSNALASAIVLICRPRSVETARCSRADFVRELRAELPAAVQRLREASLAATDLEQAAIGPGMAIYSKYAAVLEPDDSRMSIRSALALITEELAQTLLSEISGVDAETHFALSWFDENGYAAGPYGRADVTLRAKNASIEPLMRSGVALSEAGRVRLLAPQEIEPPASANLRSFPSWAQAMHVVAALVGHNGSDERAAAVLRVLGLGNVEHIKDIAYHCYLVCDRARRSTEARDFNAVVQAWPDLLRLASEHGGDTLL